MKRAILMLGAGASIEYGTPATAELTKIIKSAVMNDGWLQTLGADIAYAEIEEELAGYLTDGANFEQIYHVAHELYSLAPPTRGAVDAYKPILHPFLGNRLDVAPDALLALLHVISRAIFAEIVCCCKTNTTSLEPLRTFIDGLRTNHICRLYTTNYDDFPLQATPDLYTGFPSQGPSPRRFDLDHFWSMQDEPAIFHLHGSVHMGFPPGVGHIGELFWFDDREEALSYARFDGGTDRARKMTGTSFIPTPVVTGLDKLSLLQQRPLSHFYAVFDADVMRADVIFVIGSGLNDLHINRLLFEARSRTPKPLLLFVDYWRRGFESTYYERDSKTIALFEELYVRIRQYHRSDRHNGWLVASDKTSAIWDAGFQAFLNAPDQLTALLVDLGY